MYLKHLITDPPAVKQDIEKWRQKIKSFENNEFYHLLIGERNSRIVSSVTLVIIENLTHNMHPYALIENVVTHSEYRGKHYATILMNHASEIARQYGCYKVMLMTGSKRESTLRFYENCGFNKNDKTAFIQRL